MLWLFRAYFMRSVSYADRAKLPKQSGIYFVVRQGRILYIGKAGMGLRKRWSNHHERGLKSTDRLLYAKVPKYRCGHEEALAIRAYIKKHGSRPKFNQNTPKPVLWIELLDDAIAVFLLFLGILAWYNLPSLPAIARLILSNLRF